MVTVCVCVYVCVQVCVSSPLPEGPAVERRRQRHDGVDHGQQAEEEDEEEQPHVEVVGLGGLEDSLVRDVGCHDGPTLVVHGAEEAQHVDAHQPGSVERTHPEGERRSCDQTTSSLRIEACSFRLSPTPRQKSEFLMDHLILSFLLL